MVEATVIVAAWNAEDTVTRSIESALSQRGVSADVIVIDDASTDRTVDIVAERAAHNPHVHLQQCVRNAGPGGARNLGLEHAQGDWIAVLDSDDTMRPDRLARMIARGEAAGADVVMGNVQRVSPDGVPVEKTPFLTEADQPDGANWTLHEFIEGEQVRPDGKSLGYLKPVIRRSFIEAHGLRYNPDLRNGEDCHLILDCLAAGAKLVYDAEPDYLYTVRPGSISYRVNPEHLRHVLKADQAYQERNAAIITPEIKSLFASRGRAMAVMMQSETVLQALKAKRFGAALTAFVRHPSAAGRVFRQLFEAAGKRVS